MGARFLSAALILAAAVLPTPAFATDTSTLPAFLASCSSDQKGCKNFTHDLIVSAQNAKYGCLPQKLDANEGGDQLMAWLKGPASANPKYEKMSLEDVMWEGVDTVWPCKK